MSCFCEVAINIGLLYCGMRSAMARGGGIAKVYAGLAAYLSVLWWGYPIVWGLAEGANLISSDAEVTTFQLSLRYIAFLVTCLHRAPWLQRIFCFCASACSFHVSLLLGMTPADNPLSCLMSFGTKAVPVTSLQAEMV